MYIHTQIMLVFTCGLVTLAAVVNHSTFSKPHQAKFSYGIEHSPHRRSWHVVRSIMYRPHTKYEAIHHSMGSETEDIGYHNYIDHVGPSALGFEPRSSGYSYSSLSQHEPSGAWSRVDVHVNHKPIATSYASFNLISSKKK